MQNIPITRTRTELQYDGFNTIRSEYMILWVVLYACIDLVCRL